MRGIVIGIPLGIVLWLILIGVCLTSCAEPPPCGLISVNSTVHCHKPAEYSPAYYEEYPKWRKPH